MTLMRVCLKQHRKAFLSPPLSFCHFLPEIRSHCVALAVWSLQCRPARPEALLSLPPSAGLKVSAPLPGSGRVSLQGTETLTSGCPTASVSPSRISHQLLTNCLGGLGPVIPFSRDSLVTGPVFRACVVNRSCCEFKGSINSHAMSGNQCSSRCALLLWSSLSPRVGDTAVLRRLTYALTPTLCTP